MTAALFSRRPQAAYVKALFAAGEQGVWYDPSDMSTLYQDTAGQTPVTAVGQPVGLMLDKRYGLARGVERFVEASTSGIGGSVRVSPGLYRVYSADGTYSMLTLGATALTSGKWYEVKFNVDSAVVAGNGLIFEGVSNPPIINSTGPKTQILLAVGTYFGLKRASSAVDYQVSGVSIRELPGNHAFQATATSRPTFQRDSVSNAHLSFDGVDDWLQTVSIDFSAIDKVSFFAGIRKTSDASAGVVAELSVSSDVNSGTFTFYAPPGAGQSFYAFTSKGTLSATAYPTGVAAPITSIVSSLLNIAGDAIVCRVNGVVNGGSISDQGTGNLGSYPLFLGRRGGVSIPFNGRLYGMIIRGALSSAGQIRKAEKYLAQKAGVSL